MTSSRLTPCRLISFRSCVTISILSSLSVLNLPQCTTIHARFDNRFFFPSATSTSACISLSIVSEPTRLPLLQIARTILPADRVTWRRAHDCAAVFASYLPLVAEFGQSFHISFPRAIIILSYFVFNPTVLTHHFRSSHPFYVSYSNSPRRCRPGALLFFI